jgi:hypothetical protein
MNWIGGRIIGGMDRLHEMKRLNHLSYTSEQGLLSGTSCSR